MTAPALPANVPATMHAAFIRATGGIDQIEYGELPTPRPGPTDALVRMEASEANYVDLFVRSGAYATALPFPFVIGRDLVGIVVATGGSASRFRVGQRVWCNSLGHHGRQGAWAEYAVVAEDRLYALPSNVQPKDAAAVLHGAGTAWLGLMRHARITAGDTLFIEGGAGAVGSAVVALAHAAGAHVLASAAAADRDWCHGVGADRVFDYRAPDLYAQVQAAAPRGITVWWDASGRNRFADMLPLMALGGRVVVMSGLKGASDPTFPVGALYTRDIALHGFAISNAGVDDLAAAAAGINRLLAAGKLPARIAKTYPLAQAAKAHADLVAHTVHGRIVLVP